MILAIRAQRGVDAVGGGAQGEFAQRDQIALAEERHERLTGFLGRIDAAFTQALDQFVGRQIDEFDLVGGVEHAVGHGFAHLHAGDLGDDVVEAFDVLDVDRRVDVDAGDEQFFDVHPAFRMARARMIAVRQFVDADHARTAPERRVDVELGQHHAAMFQALRRQHFEAFEQFFRFLAPVQFDVADNDVDMFGLELARGFEHRVALADAWRGAEEDLQPTALRARLLAAHAREQLIGVQTLIREAAFGKVCGHASLSHACRAARRILLVIPACF